MSDDYDTTEKIEETETGYRMTVSCKRGMGTRDQDKVKATAKAESLGELVSDSLTLHEEVEEAMESLRGIQSDEEGDA